MRTGMLFLDRTAVLFLGIAAGVAIGYAFGVKHQVAMSTAAVAPADQAPMGTDANPGSNPDSPPAEQATSAGAKPAIPKAGAPVEPPVVAETRPAQPGIVNAIAAGRPVRIGVFGDSFGDGIWTALYNQLSRREGYQVVKFSQQATGFTRYKTLNLEDHDRSRLAGDPVDVAVISFGANDMMGVASGGHVYALLSPNWQAEIGRRVTAYVAMLRAQGAIVYWVGLPKMREAAYDANVVQMNAFYRRLMAQLGVPFIETVASSVDADGQFAAYLPDASGKPILMRANDGIHMSTNGYIRITRGLAGRIRTYVDQARGKASGAPPPPVVAAPPPAALGPPPKPAVKAPPKFEDPLAGLGAAPSSSGHLPAVEPHIPPAKNAPDNLLPPDIGGNASDRKGNE